MMTNTPEPLADRQGQILVAIVREFIRTADPVGSKHLVGHFNLSVSSATVRNDMARLEELGYLQQPHASAGRIPTDLGYRFFVDRQLPAKLGQQSRREIEHAVGGDPADLEELLRRAAEVLSRTTNLAAAAVTPRLRSSRLKHLDLAWLAPRRAVLVMVASGGRVEKRVVDLDADLTEDELDEIGGELNRVLAGREMADAVQDARTAAQAESKKGAVAQAVADALDGLLHADQDVVVGGASNLAANESLVRNGSFARVFDVIERRVPLQEAFSDAASPASVRIGSEVTVEDLQTCSLVVAPYSSDAAIGVIGPTRMEYPSVIAAVSLMARLLGVAVEDYS